MADSLRQTLMSAVKTRLETITIANGYETDIGSQVFHWKTGDWSDAEATAGGIDIRDVEDRIESSSTGLTREDHHLTVEIVAVISDGADTGETLRKATADIYKAVGVDRRWGVNWVQTTWPRTDEMFISQLKKIVGAVRIEIEIIYRTNLFDPYA